MWLVTSSKGGVEYSLTHSFVTHMNISVDIQLQCFLSGTLRGGLLSFSNLKPTNQQGYILLFIFGQRLGYENFIKQHQFFSLLKFLCKIILECHS